MRAIIVVCIILVFAWIYHFFNSTSVVKVRKDIEQIATEKGVPVKKVDRLINKFVERKGLGGAGGLGAPIIIPATPEEMFYKINVDKNAWVAFSFRETGKGVVKEYWVISQNPIITEIDDYYESPFLIFYVKKISEEEIIFGRLPVFEIMFSFIAGLLLICETIEERRPSRCKREKERI